MAMKIGLGLNPQILTTDNFRFARQLGVTHIVAHLSNWSPVAQRPTGPDGQPALWSYEELRDLRAAINAEGLELYAIENFEPGHWSDVLLDGPRRDTQIEGLKTIIRNMGRAGIPVMGYNFSLAGTGGRTQGGFARGGAESTGYIAAEAPPQDPIPNGTVWNTVYDPDAPPGDIGTVTADQLWSRLEYFLMALVPVAEEAGVRLAAHPDDPPLPTLRQTARLVYKPELYQRLTTSCLATPTPWSSAKAPSRRWMARWTCTRRLTATPANRRSPTSTSATCAGRCPTTARCSLTRAT